MRDKYYLSRSQYALLEAPTLKGTKLYTSVQGFDFGGLGKSLLDIHQQARDLAKLALREHETFNVASKEMGSWELPDVKGNDGKLYQEYALIPAKNIRVDLEGDDEKARDLVARMQTDEATSLATAHIQLRWALCQRDELYAKMVGMYSETKVKADFGHASPPLQTATWPDLEILCER